MNDTIPILEQFIEPSPVRFTPEAPGWHVLEIGLLILLLLVVFFIYRNYRKNRYRRNAINWLEIKEKQLINNNNYSDLVYTADMLAKQIGIQKYGKENVASLQGREWIDYMNKNCPFVTFSMADEQLIRSVYNPDIMPDKQQAVDFTAKIKQWIKKHRV